MQQTPLAFPPPVVPLASPPEPLRDLGSAARRRKDPAPRRAEERKRARMGSATAVPHKADPTGANIFNTLNSILKS